MAKLQRIHSMTQRNVHMRDADIESVVRKLELILGDDALGAAPALRGCAAADGWIAIASLLNYSALGAAVWPFGGIGVVGDCLCTHGSLLVELSGDRGSVRKKPVRVQLREQLELIYSDANYQKDVHLQLLEDKEGFANLEVVCSTYTQTRVLLQQAALPGSAARIMREALESSSELVLRPAARGADGPSFVRRMTLAEKITCQVEFYLDPSRMASDRFLIEQARDHCGFVPIGTLLSFPRMRKLCHPQIAAVAHVLARSPKLEVSPDSTLVRPRFTPPQSPARASVPASVRAQLARAIEGALNDASLIHDSRLQEALCAHSPPEALVAGGLGVRVPVEDVVLHPDVEGALPSSSAPLLAALRQHRAAHADDPAAAAAGALIRRKLAELLPRDGESELVRLSADLRFLERLRPTPQVRQLVPAPGFAGVPAPTAGGGGGAPRASVFAAGGTSAVAGSATLPGTTHFSLLTYNVLADMLCTVEQFPSVRVDALDWAYRFRLLCRELAYYKADILCLQEVQGSELAEQADANHHAAFVKVLGELGYEGRFVRKVRRDGTGWASAQIGCAIFWRASVFSCEGHEDVPIAPSLCARCADEPSRAHFGRGAQVGLVVMLRHRRSARALVACTTHLSCNFQEPVTQVAQVLTVVCRAAAVAERLGAGTPIIIGADLNSIPGSGVHSLLVHGALRADHPHMATQADGVRMPDFGDAGGAGRELRSPVRLHSAYEAVLGHEPLFTNFAGPPSNFMGTLDYILYAGHGLVPTHALQLPSEEMVREETCLPSSRFPSDHLPLLCTFRLADAPLAKELAGPMRIETGACAEAGNGAADGTPTDGDGGSLEAMLISPKRSRDGEPREQARSRAPSASHTPTGPLPPAANAQPAAAQPAQDLSPAPALDLNAKPFALPAAAGWLGCALRGAAHGDTPPQQRQAGSRDRTPPPSQQHIARQAAQDGAAPAGGTSPASGRGANEGGHPPHAPRHAQQVGGARDGSGSKRGGGGRRHAQGGGR